jgi:hypothetical protein
MPDLQLEGELNICLRGKINKLNNLFIYNVAHKLNAGSRYMTFAKRSAGMEKMGFPPMNLAKQN